jgi:hypothetical protein
MGAGHRHRAVAGQPVRPVVIARLERPFDQQAAKARAIDEQLRFDPAPVDERDRFDKAGLAMQRHVGDPAFHPRDARRFGPLAQERGIEPGVEVIGIVERAHHAARIGEGWAKRPAWARCQAMAWASSGAVSPCARAQPVLVHGHHVEIAPIGAEGVEIARIFRAPADELDAQLEAASGARQELALVDAQGLVEHADRRDRRLAHADRADLLAFDQGNGAIAGQCVRQHRRRHPAGRTAADNQYLADLAIVHDVLPLPGSQYPTINCSRRKAGFGTVAVMHRLRPGMKSW